MTKINRRNALALGATALSTPLVAFATPAAAKTYGPTEGKEIFRAFASSRWEQELSYRRIQDHRHGGRRLPAKGSQSVGGRHDG